MSDFLASIGYDAWVLPALLVIPVVGAVLIAAMNAMAPRAAADGTPSREGFARGTALAVFVIELVVSMGLWWSFDPALPGGQWQAALTLPWIPDWGISFAVGIDGIEQAN